MAFKPKPSGAEVARVVEQAMPQVPRAVAAGTDRPVDQKGRGGQRAVAPDYETVQVNFRCTRDFARIIAQISDLERISTRQIFARWAKNAGIKVPQFDLTPPTPRRRDDG
jgi:hypothetical protein